MNRTRLLLVLSLVGMGVAAAAGLSEQVQWLASLCGNVSSGCKETARFTLFHLPIWAWGVAYYALLAGLVLVRRNWLFWWVAVGFGVELGLIWIMVSMHIPCLFCLVNCAVVLLILVCSFEPDRFWQTLAVSLLLCIAAALVIPGENASLPAEAKDAVKIVATVKGKAITAAELELPMAQQLLEMERQIYQTKKERLDRLITERLLDEEAARRGISVQELAKELVHAEDTEVSAADVERYRLENRAKWANWAGTEDELNKRIKTFLMQERFREVLAERAKSFAGKDEVVVYLQEPQLPTVEVNIEGAPALGPADAPVTVIEFSDYLCPACRKAHEVTGRIKELYKDRIRWVFKDFPLRQHKWAEKAAEAARCAEEQDKFWPYQDVLFGSREELTPARLKQYATDLGMEPNRFAECLDSGRHRQAVERDVEAARKAGVNSTPTFVVNNTPWPGALSQEQFKELIEAGLRSHDGKPDAANHARGKPWGTSRVSRSN